MIKKINIFLFWLVKQSLLLGPLFCANKALLAMDGGLLLSVDKMLEETDHTSPSREAPIPSLIGKIIDETGRYKSFHPSWNTGWGENGNPFLRFFIDTVYENASCYCGGSGPCTQGCAKVSAPASPTSRVVPCTGEKSPWHSKGLCMRYINGALMRAVSHFSEFICDKEGQKCEDESHNDLCSQSFVFPHGFCGLSLVGDEWLNHIPNSSTSVDGKDENSVRRECMAWKSHNERLRWISLINEAGEIEDMPLFVELEVTEETLLEDLPMGAMLVGFRESPSGHIEVKTDKTKCGGPGGELQQGAWNTCFCSDFCRSMEGPFFSHYRRHPRKVIQWNPRFVEIINHKWSQKNSPRL